MNAMAWKTMDVQEQRVRFVIEATQKRSSFGALCTAYEISRPTGYLWLQRYREQGVDGIAARSRKPHHSPRRTADELERQVIGLRLRYPDWGARKLQVLLARQGVQLPRNTVHRILRRHDLIEAQQRGAAASQRFERSQPNQLWQMDFKGPKGWPQPMGPLSVLDDHSRYLIALAATGGTHAEPVQQQLEGAFQHCGVPEAMLMDHGTPWWSTHAQFGRTQLSLWLMRQGIRLYWSGIRHPQTPGQGGTFSRIIATGLGAARRAHGEPASLARCLSLGAQPCATARGARHADSSDTVAGQSPSLRSPSAPLGISRWLLGFESRLPGQAGY
jgi:transposase